MGLMDIPQIVALFGLFKGAAGKVEDAVVDYASKVPQKNMVAEEPTEKCRVGDSYCEGSAVSDLVRRPALKDPPRRELTIMDMVKARELGKSDARSGKTTPLSEIFPNVSIELYEILAIAYDEGRDESGMEKFYDNPPVHS